MIRQLDILITEDGKIKVHGDDLPDMDALAELLGEQTEPAVEQIISNYRLCG